MEITGISGTLALQLQRSGPNPQQISSRVIANRDSDGDNQLSVNELGRREEVFNRIDANGDSFVNQQELLASLQERLAGRSETSLQATLNINIIKANLGGALSGALGQSNSGILGNLLDQAIAPGDGSQLDANTRERYINALLTAGLDDSGLYGASGTLASDGSASVTSILAPGENDGRGLLFNLLVGQLGTSEDEAASIIQVLQNNTFETSA